MSDVAPPLPGKVKIHVVVLGAGASRAACPQGDAQGRPLPLMADLISVLGLRDQLEKAGVFLADENFENLYSRLASDPTHSHLSLQLQEAVFDYFSELRLPENPTVYDHLVLSLRPKDVLVSFNWDPFLVQAVSRCRRLARPPTYFHLHGNVAIGYCEKHAKLRCGIRDRTCTQCGQKFSKSRLLYPIAQKNYTSDNVISKLWRWTQQAIEASFLFSVFGYGAPASDVEAIRLMKAAWGSVDRRSMEEVEIIDIRPADDLCKTWAPFIHSHHYETHTSFYESMLATLPRRSVEMMIRMLIDAEDVEPFPIPRDAEWDQLRDWIQPFRAQEVAIGEA